MSDGSNAKRHKAGKGKRKAPRTDDERAERRRRKAKREEKRSAEKQARRAARQEAKRKRRDTALRRAGTSDFLQRRMAGLMRFLFKWAEAVGRVRASRIAARVARFAGRFARENKLGAANLAAAYPEKSEAERAAILAEVWDNLARQAIEYAFLQDLVDAFDPEHMEDGPVEVVGIEHIHALRDSGKAGGHLRRPYRQLGTGRGDRRQARPAGDRALPAADQSLHRRRNGEAAERIRHRSGRIGP